MLKNYVEVFQLLLTLREEEELDTILKEELSDAKKGASLAALLKRLKIFNAKCLEKKYPEGNIDTLMQRFSECSEMVEFPLSEGELNVLKEEYLEIKDVLPELHALPQVVLKERLKSYAILWKQEKSSESKCQMLAIIIESIRRHYEILPYNTQILTVLAFINTPAHVKGRIGQIRTGEGKSTLIAILTAFLAAQGDYVDIVTSSENLAERDCEEFSPFFKSLGFGSSHISRTEVEEKDFYEPIVFGTHTAFEFAFLRDGLNEKKQRLSISVDERYGPVGNVITRPHQWCLIDEVDSLLLDSALSAAQIGQTNPKNLLWLFNPIFAFVKERPENIVFTPELIKDLRTCLENYIEKFYSLQDKNKYTNRLAKLSDDMLKRWYESAHTALYKKILDEDYLVKTRMRWVGREEKEVLDIVIIDVDTGHLREGTQWQHGIHQFLQIKHSLEPTAPLRTIASVSQPGYFSLYTKAKYCLTGTIGEPEERKGFEAIYNLDSFSVPPHRDCARIRLEDHIFASREEKWQEIYKILEGNRKRGLPSLVIFKSIKESNAFSNFLAKKNIKHQVLNETQRESEKYILRQAGECGRITIATNTAGRGTDIKLSALAKELGGLQMIFGFYPSNRRVELQGFGRAGRQGQSGTCRMVLDLEDKLIRNLLELESANYKELGLALLEKLGSKDLLNELLHRRSLNIQKECEKRTECCEQEKIYFAKLCDYFTNLASVYTVSDGPDFEEKLLALCRHGLDLEESEVQKNIHLKLKTASWLDLKREGLELRKQAGLGKSLDWELFVNKFKKMYLRHISDLWAVYYSRLKDPLVLESSREKAYAKLKPYLLEPQLMAEAILAQMFSVKAFKEERLGLCCSPEREHHPLGPTEVPYDLTFFSGSPNMPSLIPVLPDEEMELKLPASKTLSEDGSSSLSSPRSLMNR